MKTLNGCTVLLTGASGGLGKYMARALAERGARLALTAHPGVDLEPLCKELRARGTNAIFLVADLRDPEQRRSLLGRVQSALGEVDVLINNAGVEFTSYYHELTEEQINEVIAVNLLAAMVLTRMVLPGMLERRRGHIVNISSLAGKCGPAFQEPYAASKGGLVAFTSSLRATYRGTGVSASVVVPGFVEAGIYAELKERSGCCAPALLGTSRPEAVSRAVLHVIERDIPEIIVNPTPVRPLLALTVLFPRLGEWVANKIGSNDFFRQVIEAQKRNQNC